MSSLEDLSGINCLCNNFDLLIIQADNHILSECTVPPIICIVSVDHKNIHVILIICLLLRLIKV